MKHTMFFGTEFLEEDVLCLHTRRIRNSWDSVSGLVPKLQLNMQPCPRGGGSHLNTIILASRHKQAVGCTLTCPQRHHLKASKHHKILSAHTWRRRHVSTQQRWDCCWHVLQARPSIRSPLHTPSSRQRAPPACTRFPCGHARS